MATDKKTSLVEVIPIARGTPLDTLTYFTTLPVERGAVVEVLVRGKKTPALVIAATDAAEAKGALRTADFSMKKVERVLAEKSLTEDIIDAARETAAFFAGSVGSVLRSFVPELLYEQSALGKVSAAKKSASASRAPGTLPDRMAIQSGERDRFAHYRSIIRSEFARGSSIFVLLPTIEEARRAAKALEKGIESYAFLLHSALTKSELLKNLRTALSTDHPVVIFGTPGFLGIPRGDIGTLIVERESSPAYKLQASPHPDARRFAEALAKARRSTLILSDALLRVETAAAARNGEISEFAPLQWRALYQGEISIEDMRTPQDGLRSVPAHQREKRPFTVIGSALSSLIERTKSENAHLFIFCARKGISSTTVCEDCGTTVACRACGAPVTLYLGGADAKENVFLCNRCGERRTAAERCVTCDGWRLISLGVGIERVDAEIRDKFPNVQTFRIDKDATSTSGKAAAVFEEFADTPGSVLIGTELALLYFDEPIEYAGVASMDSLLALPDFRVGERALSALLRLRGIAERALVVQTRMPDADVFRHAASGNLLDFLKEELDLRKALRYPPERLILKVTGSGKDPDTIYAKMREIADALRPEKLELYSSFIRGPRGSFSLHALLRLSPSSWPNPRISSILRALPKGFSVNVDPESLL